MRHHQHLPLLLLPRYPLDLPAQPSRLLEVRVVVPLRRPVPYVLEVTNRQLRHLARAVRQRRPQRAPEDGQVLQVLVVAVVVPPAAVQEDDLTLEGSLALQLLRRLDGHLVAPLVEFVVAQDEEDALEAGHLGLEEGEVAIVVAQVASVAGEDEEGRGGGEGEGPVLLTDFEVDVGEDL